MILLGLEILMLSFIVGIETRSFGYGLVTLLSGSTVLGAATVALPHVAALLGVALGLAWGVVGFAFGYLKDGNLPLALALGIAGLFLGFGGHSFLFSGLSSKGQHPLGGVDASSAPRSRPKHDQRRRISARFT